MEDNRQEKDLAETQADLNPVLDGATLSPIDSLQTSFADSLARYDRSYDREGYTYLLSSLWLDRHHHEKEHGNSQEAQARICEELAKVFAEVSFPTRTDYSIVDKTGIKNQEEAAFFARVESELHQLIPSAEQRAAIGKRAIEIACDSYQEKTRYQFPADINESHSFAHRLVKLKMHLGVELHPEDVTTTTALREVLPELRYSENSYGVLHHLGSGFSDPAEARQTADAVALSSALNDVKARWYGDSYNRLLNAVTFKERHEIPTTELDKQLVLEYIEGHWTLDDAVADRLMSNFDISKAEFRTAAIAGIQKTLSEYTYTPDDVAWYRGALETVSSKMESLGIETQDLEYDFATSLPQVLLTQDFRLLEQYCSLAKIPAETLVSPAHRDLFKESVTATVQRIYTKGGQDQKQTLARLDALTKSPAGEVVTEVIRSEGEKILVEHSLNSFDGFCSALEINGEVAKSFFQTSALNAMRSALANGSPNDARKLSERFGVALNMEDERKAALQGVVKIFEEAGSSQPDYKRIDALLKAVELKGIVDDPACRLAAQPALLNALQLGNTWGLDTAGWIHHRFGYREGLTGSDVLPAVKKGLETALREGHSRHVRFVGSRVAKKFPSKDVGEVIQRVWAESDGPTKVLEHLKVIPEGGLHQVNRDLGLADYLKDIGVLGPITYQRYMEHRSSGRKKELQGFVTRVRKEMDALISTVPQDIEAMRSNPRYRELILTVYPNNWGPEASFENIESCSDHSDHLAQYTIRQSQSFTLADGVQMKVRDGAQYDPVPVEMLEEQISETLKALGGSRRPEQIQRSILKNFDNSTDTASYHSAVFETLLTLEESGEHTRAQSLLIANRMASFADAQQFMRGTRAHVAESKSAEYVNVLELQDFLGDQMRESINALVTKALATETGHQRALATYHQHALDRARELHREVLSKARPEKLGLSDSFVQQFRRQYKKLTKKELDSTGATALIEACESLLIDPEANVSSEVLPESLRSRLLPIVRSQRERTFQLAKDLGHELPESTRLAAVNMTALCEFDETQAMSDVEIETLHEFFLEHLHGVLRSHREALTLEADKFEADTEATTSGERRTVNAYITKNTTSAHARKSAGVCVSVDNPALVDGGSNNQWDMPEFFQMVLQDNDTKVCLGAVLLHAYEDQSPGTSKAGTKVLVAAFNPSSTFLYQVDEQEMFSNLLSQLERFALDNKFDKIAVSSQRYNRTNRTGGDFEKAMMETVAEVDEEYQLNRPRPICHAYNYTNDKLHVVWNRPTRLERVSQWVRGLFS